MYIDKHAMLDALHFQHDADSEKPCNNCSQKKEVEMHKKIVILERSTQL